MPWLAVLMYRSMLQGAWDQPWPCRIPNNEATLRALAGNPPDREWQEHREALLSMFELTKDGKFYVNDRQLEELAKVMSTHRTRQDLGKDGAKARQLKRLQANQPVADHKPTFSPPLAENKQPEPEPEPEPSQNQREKDARELPPLMLAHKIVMEASLPRNPGMLQAVGGAIEFCVKQESMSPNAAVEFLLKEAQAVTNRGGAPNRFWFDDRGWRPPVSRCAQTQASAIKSELMPELTWNYPRKNEQMAESVWSEIKGKLQKGISQHSFDTWLKPTKGGAISGDVLFVRVPTEEFTHVGEKYGAAIYQHLPTTITTVKFIAPVPKASAVAAG
jgi:hypothetical protein